MLFNKSEVPTIFHEPYITAAYRRPYCGPLQCIKYAFTLHNDVGNFWTHFLTLIAWLVWLQFVVRDYDMSSDYNAPLLCYWIGCCSVVLLSCVAHMFNPLSDVMYHVCFMIDYTGISMYMYGGGVAYYYYERPLTSTIYRWEYLHLALQMSINISALIFTSMSRFFWGQHQHTIRAVSFLPGFVLYIVPVLLRWLECHGEDCIPSSLPYHACMWLGTVVMAIVFVSKIPERYAPGKFDIIFQSHQLFHIISSVAVTAHMKLLLLDSRGRRESLTVNAQSTGIYPSVYKSYSLFLIMLTAELCVVFVMWILLHKGIVRSNKQIKKSL